MKTPERYHGASHEEQNSLPLSFVHAMLQRELKVDAASKEYTYIIKKQQINVINIYIVHVDVCIHPHVTPDPFFI